MKKRNLWTIWRGILCITCIIAFSGCAKEEKTTENTADNFSVTDESDTAPVTGSNVTEPAKVVYEGIDMDSSLPGEEWIETFHGIIDEPKIVIFNDDTGRKTIVENGDTVVFNKSDTFGLYLPEGCFETMGSYYHDKGIHICHKCQCIVFTTDTELLKKEIKGYEKKYGGAKYETTISNNGTEEIINFRITWGDDTETFNSWAQSQVATEESRIGVYNEITGVGQLLIPSEEPYKVKEGDRFAILEYRYGVDTSSHRGLCDANREPMKWEEDTIISRHGYDELIIPIDTKCFFHYKTEDRNDNILQDAWYAFE